MSFHYGDAVKLTSSFAKAVQPNKGMVAKKKSDVEGTVWVEFVELPVLDNLRLVPISMLEKAE